MLALCRKRKVNYSIAYFNRIPVFEALYHWTSVMGRAHMCFIDAWISNIWIYEAHVSPTLKKSLAIWCFEGSNAIGIRNRITFKFYTGTATHNDLQRRKCHYLGIKKVFWVQQPGHKCNIHSMSWIPAVNYTNKLDRLQVCLETIFDLFDRTFFK